MNKPYSILLYYCYTPIAEPEEFREQHHLMCLELNLLGRIMRMGVYSRRRTEL